MNFQHEETEFLPWNPKDPFQPTTAEVYKRILQARAQGKKLVPPTSRFAGEHQVDPEALPPLDLSPAWELKTENPHAQFSIVIPSHGRADFLISVLRNLMNLDEDPNHYEVIVVQDGPFPKIEKDNLYFLKSHLCDLEPRINLKYFRWEKRKSIFRAGQSRNLGAAKSSGSYLIFLDSDMIVPPHFLREVKKSLQSSQLVQFVRHHIKPEHSHSEVLYSHIQKTETFIEEEKYWSPFFNSQNWEELPNHWKYTCTYALAVSKKDFQNIRGFNPAFTSYGFEDTDLGYRIFKSGGKLALNPTILYHLTPPFEASTWAQQAKRQELLAKTAKIFFLSNLDEDIYKHFQSYMVDHGVTWARLKAYLKEGGPNK